MKERIYSPGSELRKPAALFGSMWQDLLASRELAWRLLVRNISAQYRQSILGYLWAFVPPLFTALIWIFLASNRVFEMGDVGMPYPLYVLTGTVLWQTFADAVDSPLRVVEESRAMLAKINFPREALLLAAIGQVVFNFLVRLVLLVAVFFWFETLPAATAVFVPIGVLFLALLGVMVGVLLTPLGMLYKDISRSIAVGLQAWFFLTPVIYPVPQAAWASTIISHNPVTPLLLASRDWLLTGSTGHLSPFFWVASMTVVLLLFGWIIYRIAMPHLIARMSA